MRIILLVLAFFSSCLANAAVVGLGEATYRIACVKCHAPAVAEGMHAPELFDVKAWNIRFKKANKIAQANPEKFNTGLDYLLNSVKNGKALMAHGGLCHEANIPNKNCSDQALKAAILYMSKRKQ